MPVFDVETDTDEEDGQTGRLMSVIDNGGRGLRVTIPKQIAEEQDISSTDHLSITPTEDGFEAEVIDV
jgi:hypothetical protein